MSAIALHLSPMATGRPFRHPAVRPTGCFSGGRAYTYSDPMEEPPSPEELLAQIAQGSREAFSALYREFSAPLFGITLGMLKNRAVAEEVLQEVFLQVWKNAGKYQPKLGKASSWLIQLTRNRSIDRIRRRTRRERLNEDAKDEIRPDPFPDSPVSPLIASETAERVRQSLKSLPEEMRTVLELAFFHSLTQTEIAEYLNQPLGTVKSRIRRAMDRVRRALGDIAEYRDLPDE